MKTDSKVVTPGIPEDPDWIRLEAPAGGEAMDVAGNIDSVLFVSTMFKIYKTTDQGKTWDIIWSGNTGPNPVLIQKDTLWHLKGIVTSVTKANSIKTVQTITPKEYSLDAGKSWNAINGHAELGRQINRIKASNGTIYSIKENSTNSTVNPSEITKQTATSLIPVRFPFKHTISSLLLDSQNRLYVAVSGTYLPESNGIYCCPRDLPSVVYVSKRPLP
ncbi:hypothetical protein GO755_06015 [Spirosoma sp. HMF4905]|uniref:Exo-alpha-sialidase n=1 Tax=Spirosoma arboris TaxID=2682092 RepID=A0A7K1S757_9BACT|nr:hypothetical protein [Spirosoma arboris]MVM29580.1 hypothetical protein [Spirosoma arboris]